MKKLAKYLVLFLVVAALAGVFAFAVMADEPEAASESTAWTPSGEYENIAYGVWATEAEYLAGSAPTVEWFPNEGTVNLVYNANGGYYRIFTDTVKVAAQFTNSKTCVIDLGGHTVGSSSAYQYAWNAKADLTVKNGTWYSSGQIQGSKTITLQNLNLTQANSNFCYGFSGNLKFIDSTVTATSAGGVNGLFFLDTYGLTDHGATAENLLKRSIEFYNSDLILTNSEIDVVFFALDRGYDHGTWNVFFDSKSSLAGTYNSLMGIRGVEDGEGGSMLPEGYSSNVFFERGAYVSNALVDSFDTYRYKSSLVTAGADYSANAEGAFVSYYLVENTNGASSYLDYTRSALKDAVTTDLGNGYSLLGEPADAWTPDNAAVTYAYWASKVDYILGEAPDETATSLTIEKYGSGYIRLYGSDRTFSLASQALHLAANASLEIDLGGNTLNKAQFTDLTEGSTLVIRNGALIEGLQTYYRANVSFILENVEYTINSATQPAFQNLGAKLIRFENCVVNMPDNQSFILNYPTATAVSSVEFIGTRLNTTSTRTAPLFKMTENRWGYNNKYSVRFDKDSSVYGSVPVYASLSENLTGGVIYDFKDFPQYVYFELGFTCSAAAKPDFKYIISAYDDETLELLPDATVLSSATDESCRIYVVEPGTATEVSVYYFNENKDGTLIISDEEIILEKWAPAEDTKFAVWASEADYLAEFYPTKEYNTDMTSADLVGGYVRLYADTVCTDKLNLKSGNLVIDLADNTLTVNAGIYVQNGTGTPSLTVKNGTLNHKGGQVQFTQGTYVTYDNITLDVNYTGNIFYGSSTTNLTFNNSIININNPGNNFHFAGTTSANDRLAFNVIDTVINVNVDMTASLIQIIEQDWGYNAKWDITLDGVTLQGAGKLAGFLHLSEGFSYVGGTASLESFAQQNVALSDVTVGENQMTDFGKYTIDLIDLPACQAASDAKGKKAANVFASTEVRTANDSVVNLTIDGVAVGADIGVVPSADAYKLTASAKWLAYVGMPLPLAYNTDTIEKSDLSSVPAGTTIKLVDDVTIGTDDVTFAWADDLTIDINGKVAYINLNWLNNDSAFRPNLTIKNGTIEVAATIPGGTFQGYFGTLTFENVIFNYPADDSEAINIYGGNVRFIGGELNATGDYSTAIRLDQVGDHNLYIDGTTIRATRYAILKKVMNDTFAAFTIKNATFIVTDDASLTAPYAGGYAIAVYDGGNATANNYLDIAIENTTFTADAVIINEAWRAPNGAKRGTLTATPMVVTLVNCTLGDTSAVSPSDNITINVADKKTSIGSALQSNLTLYTNFELNFFADPSVVKELYLGGERLVGEAVGNKIKYTIPVSADMAAEALELVIIVTADGNTYAYAAEYSVIKYAEQIIASDYSDASKQLISAAMDYVQAAYAYAGKTAPQFEGVEYDSYTAEADKPEMTEAIKSAQLDLDSGFKLRFNITAGYTGTVVVDGVSYEVVDGAYNGITYFEVDMRAYALFNTAVEITADGVTGAYSLANYVVFANGVGGTLSDLANALYTYAAYANAYKTSNPNLD